jgi:hypothetical protein
MIISVAIASTTHVDAHNECLAKEALESGAEQIRSRYIPYLIEHDFNKQIGALLSARVDPLPDGEFGLIVVAGVFEDQEERQCYVNAAPNKVWRQYMHYLDGMAEELGATLASRDERPAVEVRKHRPGNIAALLETHLDSTSVSVDGRVYKVKHLVASTGDLSIRVYPNDHAPAHFHVISKQRGIDARFDLDTLEPLSVKKGSLSSRDAKRIKNFFEMHPDQLAKLRTEHARMQQPAA